MFENRLQIVLGLLVGTIVAADVAAQQPAPLETPQLLRVAVDLRDGSHLLGELSPQTFTMVSANVGSFELKLRQVQNLQFADDLETVIVLFTNQDRLTGSIDLGQFQLKMLFGDVTVGVQHIKQIVIAK